MAGAIGSLFVELRASTTKLSSDLNGAAREIKAFEKDAKSLTSILDGMGKAATTAGKALTVAVTAPIAAAAGLGLAFNAMQEQAQIGFTTMLGSATQAKQFISELKDFAAKTPFEFPGLVQAAQRLMAMGFEAKDVKPTLEAVGNAVAGLGGGTPEIDRVTLALGQMAGRGKVATQEMNQLTEVGIPAWKILADRFGVAESKLRDMVEKGVVPADKAVAALVDGMNEKFGGMLEKQSQSFSGLISTIKDDARFLAGELTTGLFNALKGPAQTLVDVLEGLRNRMSQWSDSTKAAIAVFAGVGAAIGPALFIFGQLAQSVTSIIIVLPKLQLAFTAVQGAVTALASGFIALGPGAIAVALAALVALTYKIAEATGLIDKLALKIADWRGLMKDTERANADTAKSLEANIRWLKEHGVEVNRAGKSQQQLSEETAKLTRQVLGLKDSHQAATGATKKATDTTLLDAEAKKAAEDAYKKLRSAIDSIKNSVIPTREEVYALDRAMVELGNQGIMVDDIVDALGKRALEMATKLRKAGEEIPAMLRVIAEAAQDQEVRKILAKNTADIQKELDKQLTDFEHHLDKENSLFEKATNERIKLLEEELKFRRDSYDDFKELSFKTIQAEVKAAEDGNNKKVKQILDAYNKEQQALKKATEDVKRSAGEVFDAMFLKGQNVFTSLKNMLKGGALSLGRSIFEDITGHLLGPIKKAFDDFFAGLLKSTGVTKFVQGLGEQLGGALKGIFGGGKGPDAAGAALGVAGSGGGGAGGALSSFAGGGGPWALAGGAIAGTMSLLGSMRLEGTMNAVEYNTRAAEIHQRVMIDQLFWPNLPHLPFIRENQQEQINQLDAIFNVLNRPVSAPAVVGSASTAVTSGAVTVQAPITLEANFYISEKVDRRTFRDVILPEWMDALQNNINGAAQHVTRIVKHNMAGVVTATS